MSNLPRVLLAAGVWALFCLELNEVVPTVWAWCAMPLAVFTGWIHGKMRVRLVPALGLLALLPWVLRVIVFAAAVVSLQDLQVIWDRGWLLTAPLWYFIALSHYLVPRRPGFAYAEALILAILGAILTAFSFGEAAALTPPQVDTLRLFISSFLLILTMLCFYMAYKRIRGVPPAPHIPSLTIYSAGLALLIAALILAGNRVRKEESVSTGGGVLTSNLFRFDFGDVLSLEPRIELNAELTMLYREDGPPQHRFLRRFTLSGWSEERGFFRDAPMEVDYPGGPPLPAALPAGSREWEAPPSEMVKLINQEYYLVALDPESLFALPSPFRVEPWSIWDDASFVRAYAVDSMVSYADRWELQDARGHSLPEVYRRYLLQGGDELWYRELAAGIVGDETGVWNKAAAIEDWLLSNYYYSLNPGLAPDGDQLSWFLSEAKRGYCSYFAFAMVRLCRAADIPARVAVGFFTDPAASVLGFTPVRSDQAHAWVEVWVGDYGWTAFDPTSNTMAPGEEYPMRFISPDEWLPLVEEVLTRRGEVSAVIEEMNEDAETKTSWWRDLVFDVKTRPALAVLVFFLLAVTLFIPGRVLPGLIDLRDALSKAPRRSAKGRWRRFARRLIRSGQRMKENETILEWAGRMEEITGFAEWTNIYLKAEFSPSFERQDGLNADLFAAKAGASWKKMNWRQRARGFLSPGWGPRLPWRFQP